MTYTVRYIRDGRSEVHSGLSHAQASALADYIGRTFRITATIEKES